MSLKKEESPIHNNDTTSDTSILLDFNHENEPDISISSIPSTAIISEVTWNQYPFKPKCQTDWENEVTNAINSIASDNPYLNDNIGDEIDAITAVNWINGAYGQDCRPKLYDSMTKAYYLLDTGAMTSCLPKQEGDKLNPTAILKTADGKSMPTYGTKKLDIQIGRKAYSVEATITNVTQPIIGMDFISKYRLGFRWIDDDLYITDRKAQIKQKLKDQLTWP